MYTAMEYGVYIFEDAHRFLPGNAFYCFNVNFQTFNFTRPGEGIRSSRRGFRPTTR